MKKQIIKLKQSGFILIASIFLMTTFHGWNLIFAQLSVAGTSVASQIFKKTVNSLVLIEVYDEKNQIMAEGSGFIVSADGKIVTNYHVIEHSKKATVKLANGDAYDTVNVIDIDKRKDIALIKIRAVDLTPLNL